MRVSRTGWLLLLACGLLAATLPAVSHGDLMPRGTLGYARVKNVSEGFKRLAGEDWMTLFDRALKFRGQRDREDSDPVINELRRFVNHAGALEIGLVDMMVRDPNVQMTFVLHLSEGAPATISEGFIKWLKDSGEKDLKATPSEIAVEDFSLLVRQGFAVITIGGAPRRHVDDALAGELGESLSQVERFRKWSEKASSDIELWLDMKALRGAIDKLGEKFRMDRDIQQVLDAAEWHKWDTITASAMLPSPNGGGISVNVDFGFSQPLEGLGALIRPAGSSRLLRVLPAETMGFLSVQLGNDALATWTDIARWAHETEQRTEPDRLRRNLEWARQRVDDLQRQLDALEKGDDSDKDGRNNSAPQQRGPDAPEKPTEAVPDDDGGSEEPFNPEEHKKELKEWLEQAKAEVAEYEQRLRDYKTRAFSTDPEARQGRRSDGEEMYDEVEGVLKRMGIDRAELAAVIGGEGIGAFVALPDATDDALQDMFRHNWFMAVELRDGHEAMKQKFVDWALGKALPEGASEEEREEAARRAEQMLFKKVDGGEILSERGAFSDFCVFFGENFIGVTQSEDVARRVLKTAGGGGAGLSPGVVPGGTTGSKLLYIDLGELLAGIEQESGRWDRRERRFVSPKVEVRKLLKNGLRLGVTSSESSTRISFNASTGGENSLRPLLETLTRELELDRAWRHDQDMLQDLGSGLFSWLGQNTESLKAMSPDDLKAALAAVTPAKLMADGFFSPQDGMRSAFDPAMAQRFAAMLDKGGDELGGQGGPGDMAESGYDWFGLPASVDLASLEGFGWGELRNMWLVSAAKGPWARGGRPALVLSGSNTRVVWLDEAEYKLLRQANASGRRLASFPETEPPLPAWKAKIRMRDQRWTLTSLSDRLRQAADTAREEGRELQISFDGANEEDALAKVKALLGISPDDWFELENARNLVIEAKGDKFRARLKQGETWIEIDQDGKITTSWDNE